MPQNMTKKSLFLKMHDMMDPINPLLVFLFSSTCQKEECHQKTKVEITLFSITTDKNRTLYKWRAELPMTEDFVTTICNIYGNMLQYLWQSQK